MSTCEVCSAPVSELRRGRCWGCYSRWVEARPVGIGAACCICAERRRDYLKSVELLRSWVPMCHNCAGRAGKLEPLPQSLAGIRRALRRDRRVADRRAGRPDTRVYPRERRAGDRRHRGCEGGDAVDDAMIVAMYDLADDIDRPESSDANDAGDLTGIHRGYL